MINSCETGKALSPFHDVLCSYLNEQTELGGIQYRLLSQVVVIDIWPIIIN